MALQARRRPPVGGPRLAMNAALPIAPLCPDAGRSREQLLAAAAQASRRLLESPDVLSTMPEVLRLFGEAAGVDRTTLALADVGPLGERWLEIRSQWNAPDVAPLQGMDLGIVGARRSDCFCSELQAGRSVYLCQGSPLANATIASDAAKSSVLVPFLIDGEYAGAMSFESLRAEREFDRAVIAALEIGASVVGAALQRERLQETVRRERESASEQLVEKLARANASMRANLERLASRPAEFFDHLVQEAARQVDAACCTAVVQSYESDRWQLGAFVCQGEVTTAPFADSVPQPGTPFVEHLAAMREPCHFQTSDPDLRECWPEFIAYHREHGLDSLYLLPLVFGERNLGFLALGFRVHDTINSALVELLVALGSQLTLALGMKRLAYSGKQAAVLAERNRIGQEIHDGLAQAFTGILMQLGAAEELTSDTPVVPVLNRIRDIAREGLTEARRSVLALRPDEQQQPGGLRVALRQLAERSTVTGRIVSRFDDEATTTGLPPEHEHALLRIAQEAVINAIQHAQPSQIQIRLSTHGDQLQLAVRDDGCGLQAAPELYAQQGFGLTNMRERAEAIGGRWELESSPGAGTTIRVRVPRGTASPSIVPIVKPAAQRSPA